MVTHHSVMMLSLRIKIFKIEKFGDFSSDIDFNTIIDIFRDVIFLIINHWDTKCLPAAQRKQAMRAYIYIYSIYLTN